VDEWREVTFKKSSRTSCLRGESFFESLLDSRQQKLYDGVMDEKLTLEEKHTLLKLAREALETGVRAQPLPPLDAASLTPLLRADGASFVTLTVGGNLRGCIGALEPYQPLAEDVREHAVAAALEDYRFPPVREPELAKIAIEVSRLTLPARLDYAGPDDLLAKLRPGMDGVILRDGVRRATFLPQVWEKIPDQAEFLANLCYKMGAASDTWQKKHLEVLVYQVEEFHE
jgi:AmmeMemoRadiSam system protein A